MQNETNSIAYYENQLRCMEHDYNNNCYSSYEIKILYTEIERLKNIILLLKYYDIIEI